MPKLWGVQDTYLALKDVRIKGQNHDVIERYLDGVVYSKSDRKTSVTT